MAEEKLVTVDLDHSVGLREQGGGGVKHYGPGKGIQVPERLAKGLGITYRDAEAGNGNAPAGEGAAVGGSGSGTGPMGGGEAPDFGSMKVAELEDWLKGRNVNPADLKGHGAQDRVVHADLVKAAKRVAKGETPVYTPEAKARIRAEADAREEAEEAAAAAAGGAPAGTGDAPGSTPGANTGTTGTTPEGGAGSGT